MAIPVIYQGDDTDFGGNATLSVNVDTDFDLAGCRAVFQLFGLKREISGMSGRRATIPLSFSAAETASIPVGVHRATLRVYDAQGRVRTASDDIRIKVTDVLAEAYVVTEGQEIDVEVVVRDASTLMEGKTLKTNTPNALRQAVKAMAQALGASVSMIALCVSAATVHTAPLGELDLDNHPSVVTNVDLSGLATAQDLATAISSVSLAPATNYTDNAVREATNGLARIEDLAKATPSDYATVSNRAMNAVQTESDPTVPAWAKREEPPVPDNYETVSNRAMSAVQTEADPVWAASSNAVFSAIANATPADYATVSNKAMNAVPYSNLYNDFMDMMQASDWSDRHVGSANEAFGLKASANSSRTASAVFAQMDAATVTNSAQDANIESVQTIVNSWESYWGGSNVVFEVTNYYNATSGELPRLRIREYRDGAWTNVWDEADKFEVCSSQIVAVVAASNGVLRAEVSSEIADGLSSRAPLAWGTVTDKGTPNVASNTVWMTSPETYFAGGTEYQRVAVGSGSICVLVDNGALARTVGEPGTFRFQDDGGTNYFGFAKSDSFTIGCRTDGITVDGTLVTLRYDVMMGGNDVPIVYYRQTLFAGDWVQLNNADGTATQGAPYTVTWYTEGGSYYAAINCGSNSSGFFKAETSVAGDVLFETNMKMRLDGGIECTNTQSGVVGVIRPSYNGSSVTWTWSAR